MKKIQTIIFLLASIIITSCSLDVIPPDKISAESFWKNDKDAWYALNKCYNSMKAFDIWDEMCTDNAHSQKPWEGHFELVQKSGISTAAPYGSYSYSLIRVVNNFLANVDNCVMDESIKARMKAESRFFRAFSYLELTQYYGGVPMIGDEVLAYDAPNIARSPAEDVRMYILDELAAIAVLLPDTYAGGYLNEKGRITSNGAWALRARAALYFGNNTEAEMSAKKVIDAGNHSLFRLTALNDAQKQEATEMELFVDFTGAIDKDKFTKGMFSYEALWQGENANVSNPEYIVTRQYAKNSSTVDWTRYTYLISQQMSIQNGYSSFTPMQDIIDAYWTINGQTLPTKITAEERETRYKEIWDHVLVSGTPKEGKPTAMSLEEYKVFATGSDLMTYSYMDEFKNRDSRLYVSYMFPFKGWPGAAKKDLYYRWDPDVINKNGNESWTGYSYRKMVTTDPYDQSNSADDYPTIRYAEVLLTYAEARIYNVGYDAEVQGALNDIRDRCGMPNVPTVLSKEAAIELIRNERRIELAGEGQRFDDVRRYDAAYRQKHLVGPTYAPNGYVVVDKAWNDRVLLMPFPTSVMDKNPLLTQNPGY